MNRAVSGRLVFLLFLVASCSVSASEKVDFVLVEKSKGSLTLFRADKPFAVFHVVFGANPVGHKQREGDKRTPEGRYTLDVKKPDSAFHKAIHISYPNEQDIANVSSQGVEPGGAIMVHGQKNGLGWLSAISQLFNWTDGCIALRNDDMDQVWESVDVGTPIEIRR